jgi:two-component system OmpR family sensor kinase
MLALVLGGFSTALYVIADNYLHRQASARVDAVLDTLSAAVEAESGHLEWEPSGRHLNLDFSILDEQVVWGIADVDGQTLQRSDGIAAARFLARTTPTSRLEPPANETLQWSSGSWRTGQRWIHADSSRFLQRERPSGESGDAERKHQSLSITVGVSLLPVLATLRQLMWSLAGLSVAIWSITLLVGRFVCRTALRPVRRMANAARSMHADDLTERLPAVTTRNDELAELNQSFNHLLDRVQLAFERQRSFTGDASHQLRTPLTAILGQVEVALRRDRTPAEYQQVLATVQQRSMHLTRLVESLLFLARADAEARGPQLAPLNLTGWLPQHLKGWDEHARASDITAGCQTTAPCYIRTQPALLAEMLDILLDNACKYSEPGTPIVIELASTSDTISVTVGDRGHGMDVHHLTNLFVPFRRSDEARRRGIPGVGLGLSIAKRLADLFGAVISATSQSGHGSRFTVSFPIHRVRPHS